MARRKKKKVAVSLPPDRPTKIHVINRKGCELLVLTSQQICDLYDNARKNNAKNS